MRLVERINDWHTRLEPILEEQEGRRGFDVQEYCMEILDKIRSEESTEEDQKKKEKEKEQEGEQEEAKFSEIVEGKQSWEVCRYFLSSLLLTNYGNFEVESRDPLVFRVKSTTPSFDAADVFKSVQGRNDLPPPPQQQQQEKQKIVSEEPDDDDDDNDDSDDDHGKTTKASKRRGAATGKKRGRKRH